MSVQRFARSILVRQISERADQLRLRMLWDLTAENVPEQEAWDAEHPPIVPAAPARGKSLNDMSADDFLKFMEAIERNSGLGRAVEAKRGRDQKHIAEIFLQELAKRGRL